MKKLILKLSITLLVLTSFSVNAETNKFSNSETIETSFTSLAVTNAEPVYDNAGNLVGWIVIVNGKEVFVPNKQIAEECTIPE